MADEKVLTTKEERMEMIAKKIAAFEKEYGSDSSAYRKALENADSLDALKAINPAMFTHPKEEEPEKKDTPEKENKKEEDQYKSGAHSFYLRQNEDGSYEAIGNNGQKVHAKNFEELNDSVLSHFKQQAKEEGKEATAAFNSSNKEYIEIFAKSAILKHNMTILQSSDYPKDQEFWKNLKQEYFKDSKHSLESWVKLTRFLPDDVLSRDDKEKSIKDGMLKREQIKSLRQGKNLNLETQNKPQNTLQINKEKGNIQNPILNNKDRAY